MAKNDNSLLYYIGIGLVITLGILFIPDLFNNETPRKKRSTISLLTDNDLACKKI